MNVSVCDFNHTNEFCSISRLLQDRKDSLFSLFETSTTSQIIESVCKISLFLIAGDCFSVIIVTEIFFMQFLRIVGYKFDSLNGWDGSVVGNIFFISFFIYGRYFLF